MSHWAGSFGMLGRWERPWSPGSAGTRSDVGKPRRPRPKGMRSVCARSMRSLLPQRSNRKPATSLGFSERRTSIGHVFVGLRTGERQSRARRLFARLVLLDGISPARHRRYLLGAHIACERHRSHSSSKEATAIVLGTRRRDGVGLILVNDLD
jgi:hypothetical protein